MDTPPSTVGPLSAAGKGEHRDGFAAALTDWRLQASPRSLKTIDRLTFLAKRNALTDADWAMIDTLAERFMKR